MPLLLVLHSLIQASLRMAAPLIYTSVGETYNERAGVVNIGLVGLMLIGAVTAFVLTYFLKSIGLAVASAALIAGLAFVAELTGGAEEAATFESFHQDLFHGEPPSK